MVRYDHTDNNKHNARATTYIYSLTREQEMSSSRPTDQFSQVVAPNVVASTNHVGCDSIVHSLHFKTDLSRKIYYKTQKSPKKIDWIHVLLVYKQNGVAVTTADAWNQLKLAFTLVSHNQDGQVFAVDGDPLTLKEEDFLRYDCNDDRTIYKSMYFYVDRLTSGNRHQPFMIEIGSDQLQSTVQVSPVTSSPFKVETKVKQKIRQAKTSDKKRHAVHSKQVCRLALELYQLLKVVQNQYSVGGVQCRSCQKVPSNEAHAENCRLMTAISKFEQMGLHEFDESTY